MLALNLVLIFVLLVALLDAARRLRRASRALDANDRRIAELERQCEVLRRSEWDWHT